MSPTRALPLLLLILLLCTSVNAALTVTIPSSVNEGQSIVATVSGPGTLTILIDNVVVDTGSGSISHELPTDQTSAGLRAYRFTTTDPATQNESRTVTVNDVPFSITPIAPEASDIATGSPVFSVSATWEPELCYVVIDGDTRTLSATSPTTYAATIPVADGVHSIVYKCKLGAELPSASRTIRIDTTAPIVTASSPTGTQTGSYATLTVDTDEIALCRYGTVDAPYASLSLAMGTTYATRNQITVALGQSGPQTHFIRCADVLGNAMDIAHIISFSAQRPPAATVSVDGEKPLRAGSYKVALRADAALLGSPTLTANFPAGGAQQIGLTGSGSSWEGYLTIPENSPDASVNFAFRGTGLDGTVGTELTDGAVFAVDAKPPGAITSLNIDNRTNGISLRWFALNEDEDGVRYIIYRADHEGVTYTDELARSSSMSFNDPADGARYYWYRVAAIDAAGNLGPLSDEVYGSAVDEMLDAGVLDAVTIARIDETIIDLQSTLTTANTTISQLEGEQNPFKSRIIADMRLLPISRDIYAEVDEAIRALQEAKISAASGEEAENTLTSAREIGTRARTALIRRIVPDQEVEARQTLEDRDVERNLAYALAARGTAQEDRDEALEAAKAVRDRSTVTLTASSFALWDWNNVEHRYTFVRKRIVLDDPANDVLLVEVIPKSVAESVDDISFSQEPTVLERDPVVAWSFSVLQEEEISYVVNRAVSLEDVKASRTIAYPAPIAPAAPVEESDSLTGFAVFPSGLPGTDVLLLAFGALIIVGLGAYYVALGTEPSPLRGLPPDRLAPVIGRQGRRPQVAAPRTSPEPLRIMPARSVPRSTPRVMSAPAIRVPTVPMDLGASLARAEEAIDEKRYVLAEESYGAALALLSTQGNDLRRAQAERVHRKLMLHRRLDEASSAIERGDTRRAQDALREVRSLAASIGEQPTTLIKEASRAYKEFMGRLNRLEIDHASRY